MVAVKDARDAVIAEHEVFGASRLEKDKRPVG
jgi:hypothetical protein